MTDEEAIRLDALIRAWDARDARYRKDGRSLSPGELGAVIVGRRAEARAIDPGLLTTLDFMPDLVGKPKEKPKPG